MGNAMDRQIVYPGAIPLETDLLQTNKFAMIGLAKLASAILGTHTCLQGLTCKPAVTPPMDIIIGEGQIYSLQNADETPYSSLSEDAMSVLKQGLKMTPETFSLTAPSSPGHSINYLIQAAYEDVDSGPIVLPYYNAANPAVAYSGPNNTGAAQATVRSGVCVVSKKNGIPADTGSQLTPTPDAGHVAAWVVTVSYGAKSINASDITPASSAPFLPADGLISAVQQGILTSAKATSEQNDYHASYHPPVTQLKDGQRLYFRATSTNTGPCTLRIDNLPAYPIRHASSEELKGGVFSVNQQVEVEWNATLSTWVFCNNTEGLDLTELDQRYLSLSGGEITGPLKVKGALSTDSALKVGESEINTEGDISGALWGESLHAWLIRRSPSLTKDKVNQTDDKSPFIWKDPVSKFTIQGGRFNSGGGKVKFPVAFPNHCLSVIITQSGKSGMSKDNSHISDVSIYGFSIIAGRGETSFYWLAAGR